MSAERHRRARSHAETGSPVSRRGLAALALAALVALTLAAYVPALRAGFVWDDNYHVTENPTLRDPGGLARIWLEPRALPQYYPLVHTSFWVEHRLWGLRPFGYHLTNVLLHTANALLLGWILFRLRVPGAWLAAAVFALHPVHVESVAWITERKNVLSGLFYLSALLCLTRFHGLDGTERPPRGRRGFLVAGSLLFLCALLSKTVTATLPAALLVIVWWKRGRIERRDVVPLLPLFAAGIVAGSATAWIEKFHVGAEGPEWSLTIAEHFLVAGRALWFYAGKLAWPAPLVFVYPRFELDSSAAWQYLVPLAALAVPLALWALRRRVGRGPLAAALFFGGTLFPALGFLDVFPMRYSFVADHFQYLASAGPIALACAAIAAGIVRIPPARRLAAYAACALGLASLGALSFLQAGDYRDLETLWERTLRKNPGAWIAQSNLGAIRSRQGRTEEAMARFRDALRIKPDLFEARLNLGNLLYSSGKPEEAVALQEEAVRLAPENAVARYNLGTALAREGRYEEAVSQLREAVRLRGDFAEAEYNLGTAFLKMRSLPAAQEHLRRAIELRPDYVEARINLARVLELGGDPVGAAAQRAEASRLRRAAGQP